MGGSSAFCRCRVGWFGCLTALVLALASPAGASGAPAITEAPGVDALAAALTAPSGFQDTEQWTGLTNPMAIRFAPDGRVFVSEKSGIIKVFDSVADPTPTVFADLRSKVHDFWDRGLLGLALDPGFTTGRPFVYVLYAYDHMLGDPAPAPRWGDTCPTPPGATGDGCVISGRLSRLNASGTEQVLIEDWCQQYPSHSLGSLAFGADGALYVSSGDGASFNFADYGQDGSPVNPCGDPPGGVGGAMTPPTAQGGALRAQDVRTTGDPTGLSGSILRVDPDTGAALADNPNAGASDPNARRIVAHGFRNPFRITVRPGTNEVWAGDVGWNDWEEIDRIPSPTAGVLNFGWPCYEGAGRMASYESLGLSLCDTLYAQGAAAHSAPLYTYDHGVRVVPGDDCGTGGSSISGLAFYNGGTFPSAYNGALFFADYSRRCIWVMFKNAAGLPDPSTRQIFVTGGPGPVDLQVGPGGDLFYVDLDGGTIHRVHSTIGNQAPTARATVSPQSGAVPLTVTFDGRTSSDPNGDTLAFAWDLDDDGAFDDSTSPTPPFTYSAPGDHTARLRVSDPGGLSDTTSVTVRAGTPPSAIIDTPTSGTTWRVGQTVSFSGSGRDSQGNLLAASHLVWNLNLEHCNATGDCHTHPLQTFTGVASGSFSAPDHEFPSHLELQLKVTDDSGLSTTVTRQLDPRTVHVSVESDPPGLQISVGSQTATAPFTREVIEGSANSVSAPSPQTLGSSSYDFASWSDGGAASHNVTANSDTTIRATYTGSARPPGLVAAYGFEEASGTSVADASGGGNTGTISGATRTASGRFGSALSFDGVNDWVTVADSPSLDLSNRMTIEAWVNLPATGSVWRTVALKEQAGGLVYALYAGEGQSRPSAHVFIGGELDTRGTAATPLNAWTHLTTTYDGSTLRLYVNGTQVSSRAVTGSMAPSTGPLRLGGNGVWNEWLSGRLDEVRVYNRALSVAEIQSDMANPVGTPAPAVLDVTPGSLSFSGDVGGQNPAGKDLSVNSGGTWTASDDAAWLSLSKTTGSTPDTLTATANLQGLAAGTYTGNVTITAAGAQGSPKVIPVVFTVSPPPPPTLSVSPSSLSFAGTVGDADPAAKDLTVSTGGAYTATKDAGWISLSKTSGSSPDTIAVSARLQGLAAGTYNGTVTVSAAGAQGSPKSIPVTLTLQPPAPPVLAVSPTSLSFSAVTGGPAPAGQDVSVTNAGGGTLTWTAQPANPWVSVSPASGGAPATARVSVNPAGLPAGTNTSSVTFTGSDGSTKQVAVTLSISSPSAGLVAAYGFEETAGTAVTDSSGTGNAGTTSGPTRITTGRFGRALSFDGVNDWVTIPDASTLDLSNRMTLEAYVFPAALGSTWRTVLLKEQPGQLVYALYAGEGTPRPSGHVYIGGDLDTRGTAALPLNAWTHLAVTYDGAALRLFVNGTQVSTRAVTGSMPNSTGVLRIGGNNVWAEWFSGRIDEVRVYNRALTAADIQADMARAVVPGS